MWNILEICRTNHEMVFSPAEHGGLKFLNTFWSLKMSFRLPMLHSADLVAFGGIRSPGLRIQSFEGAGDAGGCFWKGMFEGGMMRRQMQPQASQKSNLFCSSGYVVGLSWTLQCLSMFESWNFLRSSVWMILSGYTLRYSNVLEHHHQNNKISCQLQAGHLYHFVNCTATNTSGPIPGQEAQSLVYIRVQQAARLGHRDLEFPKPTSSIYAAYHNPVLVGEKWELLGIE